MKIDQIPFPIKVRVLRRHIVGGVCKDAKKCGLAIATQEAIYRKTGRYAAIQVHGGYAGIQFANSFCDLSNFKYHRARFAGRGTLQKIRSFVVNHDACRLKAERVKVVKPFSFIITGVHP